MKFSSHSFLEALPPSAVKSLVVCYALNGSSANLTVAWGQPKWLEGNLQFYEIVITLNDQEMPSMTTKVRVWRLLNSQYSLN